MDCLYRGLYILWTYYIHNTTTKRFEPSTLRLVIWRLRVWPTWAMPLPMIRSRHFKFIIEIIQKIVLTKREKISVYQKTYSAAYKERSAFPLSRAAHAASACDKLRSARTQKTFSPQSERFAGSTRRLGWSEKGPRDVASASGLLQLEQQREKEMLIELDEEEISRLCACTPFFSSFFFLFFLSLLGFKFVTGASFIFNSQVCTLG